MDVDMHKLDMQLRHGHAAWELTCSMGKDMQHEHGQGRAVWTLTCRMNMDVENGHGHAALKHAARLRTYRLDMTMHMASMDTEMQNGHGLAARTGVQHRYGPEAWTWHMLMDRDMQHEHVH
jgi:hypothetical protein